MPGSALSRAIASHVEQVRALAQQPPQGQVEVPLRQPVQVQLGQQPAHGLRAPLEQWQQPTLEPRRQPAHPGPADRERARHRTQPPGLAEPVPRPGRGVDGRPPLIAPPAQDLLHLFLQQLLQQPLDPLPGQRLQALPHRP